MGLLIFWVRTRLISGQSCSQTHKDLKMPQAYYITIKCKLVAVLTGGPVHVLMLDLWVGQILDKDLFYQGQHVLVSGRSEWVIT